MIGVINCDFNVFERFDKFNVYCFDIDIKKVFSGIVRYFVFGLSIYNCVGVVFVKLKIEIDLIIKDNISRKKLRDIKDFVKKILKMNWNLINNVKVKRFLLWEYFKILNWW